MLITQNAVRGDHPSLKRLWWLMKQPMFVFILFTHTIWFCVMFLAVHAVWRCLCLCVLAYSLCVVKYACRHLPVLFRRMLCFLSTLAVFCGRLWVSSPMQAFANSSGIYFYLSCSSWLPLISSLTSVCLLCYFIFTVCHVTVTSFSCYHLQWWVSSANKKVFVEFNLILNIYYLFVHLWYIYIFVQLL